MVHKLIWKLNRIENLYKLAYKNIDIDWNIVGPCGLRCEISRDVRNKLVLTFTDKKKKKKSSM